MTEMIVILIVFDHLVDKRQAVLNISTEIGIYWILLAVEDLSSLDTNVNLV